MTLNGHRSPHVRRLSGGLQKENLEGAALRQPVGFGLKSKKKEKRAEMVNQKARIRARCAKFSQPRDTVARPAPPLAAVPPPLRRIGTPILVQPIFFPLHPVDRVHLLTDFAQPASERASVRAVVAEEDEELELGSYGGWRFGPAGLFQGTHCMFGSGRRGGVKAGAIGGIGGAHHPGRREHHDGQASRKEPSLSSAARVWKLREANMGDVRGAHLLGRQSSWCEGRRAGAFGGLDCTVHCNFFGSQLNSFEAELPVPAIATQEGGAETCRAVFIRAPAILSAVSSVELLAEYPLSPSETVDAPERR